MEQKVETFDLAYEGDRYLILYATSLPIDVIYFRGEGEIDILCDCFSYEVSEQIVGYLRNKEPQKAGKVMTAYMEENPNEGGSSAGLTTREDLEEFLADRFLPILDNLVRRCGLQP